MLWLILIGWISWKHDLVGKSVPAFRIMLERD